MFQYFVVFLSGIDLFPLLPWTAWLASAYEAGMHPILVTAHSGCLGTAPNSLEFVAAALDAGADFLELDLRLGEGGVLALSHDPLHAGISPLTLEQVWSLVVRGGSGFNLDIKEPEVLVPLVTFLDKQPDSRNVPLLVTGCHDAWVTELRRLAPWLSVLLNVETGASPVETPAQWEQRMVTEARLCGAAGLNAHHGLVTPGLADRARRAALPLFVWTVNRVPDLRRLVSLGVSGVTTDHPNRPHRILTGF